MEGNFSDETFWRTECEKLAEALAEQVAECFDERCEMCMRHESILASHSARLIDGGE